MPKPSLVPLEKVTLNLFDGDFARLGELYPSIGPSLALRKILRAHIAKIELAANMKPLDHKFEVKPHSGPAFDVEEIQDV